LGKKVPFAEIKRNIFGKDLKEILRERLSFCREPSKVPRNLDGLLQKLKAESKHDTQYGVFRDSDIWRRNKTEESKNSINVKNWYYKRDSETSDTDDERDESFDCNDQNSCLRHIREDQFINTQKKKSQQESKFNQARKDSHSFPEVCDRTCRGVGNIVSGENVKKSEELLKTLEHLREEAKDVAETLEKLRKSVSSEEDNVVQNFFSQKLPVAAGS